MDKWITLVYFINIYLILFLFVVTIQENDVLIITIKVNDYRIQLFVYIICFPILFLKGLCTSVRTLPVLMGYTKPCFLQPGLEVYTGEGAWRRAYVAFKVSPNLLDGDQFEMSRW